MGETADTITSPVTQADIQAVRTLVRARMDFQAMRKSMSNRIGKKADGSDQNISDGRMFMPADIDSFVSIADEAKRQEGRIERMLLKTLKRFPVYNEFLERVKGVGPISAGWIVCNINIEVATTVSKIWQYCGLNPGMVQGKKRIPKSKHSGEKIVREVAGKDGKVDLIVLSGDLIKGDRATPGYVLPYNKPLRTALVEVMADGFIKAQNPYCMDFYYPYKERLSKEKNTAPRGGSPCWLISW